MTRLIFAICLIVFIAPWAVADWRPLGEWRVTAYCPCAKCCGAWADGRFADNTPVDGQALKAVAAPKSIPLGTLLYVEGIGQVVVRDRGGAIRGKRLDVFHARHADALQFGVTRAKVWRREQ